MVSDVRPSDRLMQRRRQRLETTIKAVISRRNFFTPLSDDDGLRVVECSPKRRQMCLGRTARPVALQRCDDGWEVEIKHCPDVDSLVVE